MALHRLAGIHIGATDPQALDRFYAGIGFTGGNGTWGAEGAPTQIRIHEAPYRQFQCMQISCDSESDLDDAAARLAALGVTATRSNGRLAVQDPVNGWSFEITPRIRSEVPQRPARATNHPGIRDRINRRADVITETTPRTPRRLGHVVLGSPDPKRTVALCQALGFRISDTIGGGIATFMRCSPDHHNLLIAPAPAPYLNHYALEMDDFDAVMKGATRYLMEHGQNLHIAGPGRHQIGGNVFWYMRDPSGNYFEFFTDMDQITDDGNWVAEDWSGGGHWSVWGEQNQPEALFMPPDMPAIIAGWQQAAA